MPNKKRTALDGLTVFLAGLLMLFLVGGGGAGWYVYSVYHEAFPDGVRPKAAREQTRQQVVPTKPPGLVERDAEEAQARAEWGQLGDYFGGTLNPLFGFVSVLALLITLIVQSKELRLSTRELENSSKALRGQNKAIEHQSFEQTFFAWLNNYHELLQSIAGAGPIVGELHGRAALYGWWGPGNSSALAFNWVREQFAEHERSTAYSEWIASLRHHTENEKTKAALEMLNESITPAILRKWEAVYLKHEYQLDSLFRNLYRLILWIHSQHESKLTPAQKWLYVGIVRGQLSWIEQVYLFYNGLTERGGKFRKLVNTYALFDNLTFENDPVLEYVRHNPPGGVAYMRSAFDSVAARRALGLPDTAEETMALAAGEGRQDTERD
ncbi:MAG: hypothetical protein A2580_07525 [Hydrogenophilales bacterium RIFOXYD1_FULL_62_11]|nr:MAG: hypothetical protein A2580_07525 [Hydrogenophilales bacterium RIFOXYD1_FULL_62_11]